MFKNFTKGIKANAYFAVLIAIIILFGICAIYLASELHVAIRNVIFASLQERLSEIALMYRDGAYGVPIKAVFVGDIMLSRAVGEEMEKRDDYNYPFREVAGTLNLADITFGNLEGPISAHGENRGSEYSFRADPRAVQGLVFSGFDVMSIANNHILDWGADALAETVDILRENGIHPVGAGVDKGSASEPAIISVRGTKIAFLAYTPLYPPSLSAGESTPGVNGFSLDRAVSDIRAANERADVVFVSMHWGDEYRETAGIKETEIGHAMIDAGADAVIGHHPHVVQQIENYAGGWIAYSLGNFVFDQTFSRATREGAALSIEIRNGKITDVSTSTIYISSTFQPAFIGL